MDSVLAHDQFTPKQVRRIHCCRVYLQVLTLVSDITLANGTHLDPHQEQDDTRITHFWKCTVPFFCDNPFFFVIYHS
jgi:hypothetical protein